MLFVLFNGVLYLLVFCHIGIPSFIPVAGVIFRKEDNRFIRAICVLIFRIIREVQVVKYA